MGEPIIRSGTPGAAIVGAATLPHEISSDGQPQYLPYRPPGSEFTPPASPRPMSPFVSAAASPAFNSPTVRKRPAPLQMDSMHNMPTPAYERPQYSPSPIASPSLPPSLPSPQFARPRALSLLRQQAASSPLNDGFPRAEQVLGSPTFAPSMMRQASGPGPTSDPRSIFNPLASNPVNQSGPAWRNSREDLPAPAIPLSRPRGMTSSSQQGFNARPLLRAATSIPDYDQYRAPGKPNPSGAYRPDRGGTNWSHMDQYPMPPSIPSESRASFRSAWTHASSFVDASGTERSSIITGRSSISDPRMSVYSAAQSEEQDRASEVDRQSIDASDLIDDYMSVEDVIDSYCYDEEDEEDESMADRSESMSRLSSSVIDTSDPDLPGLSQTNSQNSQSDQGSSRLTPEPFANLDIPQQGDERPFSWVAVRGVDHDDECISPTKHHRAKSSQNTALPALRISTVNMQTHGPASPTALSGTETPVQGQRNSAAPQRQPFGEIYNELRELPQLPKDKSRLSRADWSEIQAYARKNSKGSVHLLEQFGGTSPQRPVLALHTPEAKEPSPLPEVDQDDAYPRRASTSVFDRRSGLFDLNKIISSSPPPQDSQSVARTQSTKMQGIGKRQSGQTLAGSPVSPVSPSSPISSRYIDSRSNSQTPRQPVARDRYGFKKATDKISAREYDAWYNSYEAYVGRRRGKWVALMERSNLPTTDPVKFPAHSEKVRRYARKGYPPEWRGAMWWFYSKGQKKLDQMPGLYASLVQRVRQGELNKDDAEAIERDLDRTFPDNIHFRPDTPENPDGTIEEPAIVQDLREVLQCFALNNPGIGYCQSLNFIAGLLLLFMKQDNEKVFVLLTIITQYHLPGAHARSLANTEVNVLMMLIRDYLPKVWASINDTDIVNNGLGSNAHPDSKYQRQPTVALSCTSWFMSLFVGVLPIEVVLRVWDSFLYEGPRALFRYALAIFKLGEPEIRRFHPGDGELFMTVQNLPRKCLDPNVLHDIAFVKRGFGSLSQGVVDQKRLFWQQQQQIARDRSKRSKKSIDMPARRAPTKDPFLAVIEEAKADDERRRNPIGLRRKASASRRFFKKLDRA